MIGSPLATILMNHFRSATDPGVWQTFVTLAVIYFAFMLIGAFGYRVPPMGWKPKGWKKPTADNRMMITTGNVHLNNAHRTPQFWLLWLVLCMNVSAGIGIIGAASPMLQETFGGDLVGAAGVGFAGLKANAALAAKAAGVGAGFVGLISLFNIFGRFGWASSSDNFGRKTTYFIFFVLGAALYIVASLAADWKILALFVGSFCVIASMYGGGFATVPAYLADLFGTQFVGAIHGRLLTAWSTAGIVGPVIVNYMHDTRQAAGIAPDQIYGPIFYVLAALLGVGFVANLLIRPVDAKWYMSKAEVDAEQAKLRSTVSKKKGSFGIGMGGFDREAAAFWALVGIPLAWGIWNTVEKALVLFH
jgi:MFS family permease